MLCSVRAIVEGGFPLDRDLGLLALGNQPWRFIDRGLDGFRGTQSSLLLHRAQEFFGLRILALQETCHALVG